MNYPKIKVLIPCFECKGNPDHTTIEHDHIYGYCTTCSATGTIEKWMTMDQIREYSDGSDDCCAPQGWEDIPEWGYDIGESPPNKADKS